MARLDTASTALTPYERAACYFTLPRVARPMPAQFVFVFGGLLLGLLTALCVVAVNATSAVTYVMVLVVMAAALVGIVIAMAHSLVNEIRKRRVLEEARQAPEVRTQDDTLPDPFAGHVLLRHPGNAGGRLTACTTSDDTIEYFLDNAKERGLWEVRTPQDEEMLTVRSTGGVGSFAFLPERAGRFRVCVGEAEVAIIRDAGNLFNPHIEIIGHTPEERTYEVKDGGLFTGGRLVGRTYYIHEAHYLDIQKEHLNEGILGYFVSIT